MFNQIFELQIFQLLVKGYSNSKCLWKTNVNIVRIRRTLLWRNLKRLVFSFTYPFHNFKLLSWDGVLIK